MELTVSLVSSQGAWKETLGNGSRRNHRWQDVSGLDLDDDFDDYLQPVEMRAGSYARYLVEEQPPDLAPSSSAEAENNFVKAMHISALMHPTHEILSSPVPLGKDSTSSSFLLNLYGAQDRLAEACDVLGLTMQVFQQLLVSAPLRHSSHRAALTPHRTDSYFDNMTAFSLFHRPSFENKILGISRAGDLQALFAALFSFSARFEALATADGKAQSVLDHTRFHRQGLELIERSLEETPDRPPSLSLLQALILITFHDLTTGVRGRGWRHLGTCVRLAYELNLHLIDYEAREDNAKVGQDLARWTADEERRRCWWAIWEMDNYASTIRRCPTAIDCNMIDTYLPIKDELWFNNEYQPSRFLEREPANRWKVLKECGNDSPTAWLIVLCSIMRDAQVLLAGNLHGILLDVDPHENAAQFMHYFRNSFCRRRGSEDATKLNVLIEALHRTTTELPEPLVYRGEYLDFGSSSPEGFPHLARRRLQSAKYSIHLTTQLGRFMISHSYGFEEIVSGTIFSGKHRAIGPGGPPSSRNSSKGAQGWQASLQAADNICALARACSKDHVKHVNPLLASTIWLAAALYVLKMTFAEGENLSGRVSGYEILRATCEHYAEFWHTPPALLTNLDSLEGRLRQCLDSSLATAAAKQAPPGSERTISVSPTTTTGQSKAGLDGMSPQGSSQQTPLPYPPGVLTGSRSRFTSSATVLRDLSKSPSGADEDSPSLSEYSIFNHAPQANNSLDSCLGENSGKRTNTNMPMSTNLPVLDGYLDCHDPPIDQEQFPTWGDLTELQIDSHGWQHPDLWNLLSEPNNNNGAGPGGNCHSYLPT